jgi:hypothetical protein
MVRHVEILSVLSELRFVIGLRSWGYSPHTSLDVVQSTA